jgi:hypothetical protein
LNKKILKSIDYLEQPQAQIWAKVLGGSGDDQLGKWQQKIW